MALDLMQVEHLLVVLDDTPFTLWGPGSCEILGKTATEAIGDFMGHSSRRIENLKIRDVAVDD